MNLFKWSLLALALALSGCLGDDAQAGLTGRYKLVKMNGAEVPKGEGMEMTLGKDGSFTWKSDTSELKGFFGVKQDVISFKFREGNDGKEKMQHTASGAMALKILSAVADYRFEKKGRELTLVPDNLGLQLLTAIAKAGNNDKSDEMGMVFKKQGFF